MCYDSICVEGDHAPWSKHLVGGHVLVESMSSWWHIIQYVMFYWKKFLTRWHVFLDDIYYRRASPTVLDVGVHVLQKVHLTGWFVLHEDAPCMKDLISLFPHHCSTYFKFWSVNVTLTPFKLYLPIFCQIHPVIKFYERQTPNLLSKPDTMLCLQLFHI